MMRILAELIILFSFVDRDMVMRFYWGLGVGHIYSHQSQAHDDQVSDGFSTEELANIGDETEVQIENKDNSDDENGGDDDDAEGEDVMEPGLGMEDRENEGWMNEDSDQDEDEDGDMGEEDTEFLERYDMYGL